MKRILIPIAIAGVAGIATIVLLGQRRSHDLAVNAPPAAATDVERTILSVLEQARDGGQVYLEVPASSGRMLRLLTEAVGAKAVVEVGTSTGYSGLWFCLALVHTGGKLTTFEIDRSRAATARRHFEQAHVSDRVTLIEGDAHQNIRKVNGPIDVLFLDADKPGYVDYLNTLLPLVRNGGLIIADNIEMAPEYERAVTSRADLETVNSGSMAITLKKRQTNILQTSAAVLSGFRMR